MALYNIKKQHPGEVYTPSDEQNLRIVGDSLELDNVTIWAETLSENEEDVKNDVINYLVSVNPMLLGKVEVVFDDYDQRFYATLCKD